MVTQPNTVGFRYLWTSMFRIRPIVITHFNTFVSTFRDWFEESLCHHVIGWSASQLPSYGANDPQLSNVHCCHAVETNVHPFGFLVSFCIFVATFSCFLGNQKAQCTVIRSDTLYCCPHWTPIYQLVAELQLILFALSWNSFTETRAVHVFCTRQPVGSAVLLLCITKLNAASV